MMPKMGEDGVVPSRGVTNLHSETSPQDSLFSSSPLQETLSKHDLALTADTEISINENFRHAPDGISQIVVSQPNACDFDAERVVLFSEIQNKIDEETKHGQLNWVYRTGWSHQFTTSRGPGHRDHDIGETVEPALRAICTMIWSSHEKNCPDLLRFLFDELANAVRCENNWRILFGKCGIVDRCLDLMQMEEAKASRNAGTWLVSAVRFLANCCGDPNGDGSADNNRAQVLTRLPLSPVINMMIASDQQTEAVSLVYNVGVYNRSFQIKIISAGLLPALWKIMQVLGQPGSHDLRPLGPACEMLTWAPDEVDVISDSELFQTLSRISQRELPCEDVESLIETVSFVLNRHGLPGDPSTFMSLLDFILSTCTLEMQSSQDIPPSATSSTQRFSGEDENLLEGARKSLIVQLSELSGRSNAALKWPVARLPIEMMLRWFNASHFQLRICSLTMLGNFAYQSETPTTSLMQEVDLCDRLATLLKSESNGLVLETALGAVQRFARFSEHRLILGHSGIMSRIAPNWVQETNIPLQEAALSATRCLLRGSLGNINLFLTQRAPPKPSLLHLLLETFQNSEVSKTRLDIAWTLERIWRSIYSESEVQKMCEDEDHVQDTKSIATILLSETIPRVYRTYPTLLKPFLEILTSGTKDQVVAATYTLPMMTIQKEGNNAVYNTICVGDGRAVFLSTIQDMGNPKAQVNSKTLLHQLKNNYTDDTARSTVLSNLLEESKRSIVPNTSSSGNEKNASEEN